MITEASLEGETKAQKGIFGVSAQVRWCLHVCVYMYVHVCECAHTLCVCVYTCA